MMSALVRLAAVILIAMAAPLHAADLPPQPQMRGDTPHP